MHLGLFFQLTREEDVAAMNRAKSVSVSEEESDYQQHGDCNNKRKHRRGKKRTRPKWKPYSKMTFDERKQLEEWEANHVLLREAEINARSKRPVAPFNSTQFLMDDRSDTRFDPQQLVRTMSFDSSSSGGDTGHVLVTDLTPPHSDSETNNVSVFSFSLGDDVHYELSDEGLQEEEAFLEAGFNQVYNQVKINRLESMSKQDLVSQCCNLEDKVSSIEQEKLELLAELHQLKQTNGELATENSRLKQSKFTVTTTTTSPTQ